MSERDEIIEECAQIAASFRRRRVGRDRTKAYWDPCGRWEGGEIYEEGAVHTLIAERIRALKTPVNLLSDGERVK